MNRLVVENTLLQMGIPASLKGFAYITDAMLLMDMPEWNGQKWLALYWKIAQMNATTDSSVERAIRHALALARGERGDYEIVNHYIGFLNLENSASLSMLYKILKEEEENSRPREHFDGLLERDEFQCALRGIIREELQSIFRKVVDFIEAALPEDGRNR